MTVRSDRPDATTAEYSVLFDGYVRRESRRVGSTVTFARDGDTLVVIDPGLVPSQRSILDPLAALGVDPAEITDVVLSHHHPDHTLNAALFPNAAVHDFWACYRGDLWESRDAEGVALSPSIRLIQTPGHTREDISTLIGTDEGVVACTHLWWSAEGPAKDPYAPDPEVLHASRARVLAVASLIIPGHGAPFVPDDRTPR